MDGALKSKTLKLLNIGSADLEDVRPAFGQILRHWRHLRGLSQLELALRASTTSRHLSFVETGRSRPRRGFILRLAEVLDVPDRVRGEWLAAAGFAHDEVLDDLDLATLDSCRRAAADILALPTPVPAMIVGPAYQLIAVNDAATRVLPELARADTIVDAFLAASTSPRLANPEGVLWGWHARLLGDVSNNASNSLRTLVMRVERRLLRLSRPGGAGHDASVIRPIFRLDGQLVCTIGVTVQVRISRAVGAPTMEAFYPLDAEAKRYFDRWLVGNGPRDRASRPSAPVVEVQ